MAFWDSEIFKEAEEAKSYSVLPKGVYEVVCTEAKTKQTKNGMGYYLNLELEVVGPNRVGAKLFAKINVHNSNRMAVTIGLGQLHQICDAVGATAWWEKGKRAKDLDDALKHLDAFHAAVAGKAFLADVTVKTDDKYGDSNEVKRFAGIDRSQDMEDEQDIPF